MATDTTESAELGEINKYNFRTETQGVFKAQKGINAEIVNQISDIKNEPDWMRDGPSSVTLLSHNRYLVRSLSDSLPRWRENNFVWEHFGRRIDVQHADLWRRVDRALCIHRVEACLVSSRLVSVGASPVKPSVEESQKLSNIRVDSPHRSTRGPQDGNGPTDQLRRWLLRGNPSDAPQEARRRFTAKDLLESR